MDPEITVLLKNGDLLLWSAFLNHFVHPKLRHRNPRIDQFYYYLETGQMITFQKKIVN